MNGTGMGAVFPLVLGSARLRSKSLQLGMSVSSKEALPKLPKDDTCKCVQTKQIGFVNLFQFRLPLTHCICFHHEGIQHTISHEG